MTANKRLIIKYLKQAMKENGGLSARGLHQNAPELATILCPPLAYAPGSHERASFSEPFIALAVKYVAVTFGDGPMDASEDQRYQALLIFCGIAEEYRWSDLDKRSAEASIYLGADEKFFDRWLDDCLLALTQVLADVAQRYNTRKRRA